VKESDMVVIKNSQAILLQWALGPMVKVLPETDKVIRVVKLMTKQSIIIKPVVKLILLLTE